jgi:3-hydroxymyristoyl/3-hydroxydecanoyl-(acyl carrier protein) dehydratase
MIKIHSHELPEILQITAPFIMIDYAFDVKPGESANGYKKLNNDDWFFECHLKKEQAMPGTLQIEALLQTLVLSIYTLDEYKGKLAFVINIKSKLLYFGLLEILSFEK